MRITVGGRTGLIAVAAITAMLAVSAPASAVPPTTGPGDPKPNPSDCLADSDFSMSVSSATAALGDAVTIRWSVTPAPKCLVNVSITGDGFSTETLSRSGSRSVVPSRALGQHSWFLDLKGLGRVLEATSVHTQLVTAAASPVAIGNNADGRLELIRTTGSSISHRSQTSRGVPAYSNWFGFDGALTSVATFRDRTGALQAWGVNADGLAFTRRQVGPNAGAWTDWIQPFSNPPATEKFSSIAVSPNAILATSPAGHLWSYSPPAPTRAGLWSRIDDSGPPLASIAVEDNANGQSEMIGLGTDDSIWYRSKDLADPFWSSATQLPGQLHSVALARFPQSGQLEIFGANAAGQIFYCAQKTANDPTSWDSCWQSLGGSLKAVSAEANPDGSIDLFGVNSGGQYFLRTTPGGTEWHNDTQFDEATSAGTVTPPRFDFLSRTASGLTVQWDDQSTNELGFAVERQDNFGLWNPINLTPTLNSGGTSANLTYSFSDGTVADGCYRVIAYNHDDSGVSAVHCSS